MEYLRVYKAVQIFGNNPKNQSSIHEEIKGRLKSGIAAISFVCVCVCRVFLSPSFLSKNMNIEVFKLILNKVNYY
jgi:hypothetical protein